VNQVRALIHKAGVRRRRQHQVLAVLVSLVAGCGYDAATSISYPPPVTTLAEGLWTASGSPAAILRLSPEQLTASGDRTPATIITTPSAPRFLLVGMAFDRSGTLWLASRDDSLLLGFAPAILSSSGPRAASTVIRSSGEFLGGPSSIAFDSRHRLWVLNNESGTLVRFDPAQLAAGGAQSPAVFLVVPGKPTAIAFDAAGSLWVSDHEFHTITRYTADQLEASGTPSGRQVLTAGNGLAFPSGIAFDAAGNLWIANSGGPTLIAFSAAQLGGASPGAPHTVISSRQNSLNLPLGLAFDGAGSLWVVGGEGSVIEYDHSSLAASGAPEPTLRLQLTGRLLLWSAAFWPKPAGLPLN